MFRAGLSLVNVSFLDEEVVDLAGLVDVDLDEGSGLSQPQAALPPALVQEGLLVFQVRPGDQPHHLTQLRPDTSHYPTQLSQSCLNKCTMPRPLSSCTNKAGQVCFYCRAF